MSSLVTAAGGWLAAIRREERERERGSKTTAGAPVWLAGLVMGMHVRLRAFAMPLDHGVVVVASAQRPVSV
jgi:hypothetical protein